MHTCPWPGPETLCRKKWRKPATASLLFHCIDGCSCLGCLIEFFLSRFWVSYIEVFQYCTFTKAFAIGFRNWFDHDWFIFRVFFWICLVSLTPNLDRLKPSGIVSLFFFFNDIKLFRKLSWGLLWSVLQFCLYFVVRRYFNIDW